MTMRRTNSTLALATLVALWAIVALISLYNVLPPATPQTDDRPSPTFSARLNSQWSLDMRSALQPELAVRSTDPRPE